MFPIRIILEVSSPEEEALVRQHHAFLQEMSELALKAPSGHVIDVCEEAVLEKAKSTIVSFWSRRCKSGLNHLKKKAPLRT